MNKRVLAAAVTSIGSLCLGYGAGAAAQDSDAAADTAATSTTQTPAADGTAQDTQAATAAAGDDQIATVLVTARRREEKLEKVPTSITALGAQQLTQQGIVSQSDLQSAVPGLTVRQTQGSNSLTFSIRGQTVDAFTGSRSAVVPYFDDVQLNSGGASTFFDLESVQVLKGPQGTLFGRNTTGGAVLYTSTKPKDELGGYARLRVGNYGLNEGQGAFNAPLFDHSLLVRLAADVTYRDGWQKNLYDGRDLGEISRQSGRLSALWKPNDALQNLTVAEVDHSGGNSTATRLKTVNRCGDSNNGYALNCAADYLFNPNTPVGPDAWANYLAHNPHADPDGIAAYLDNVSPHIGFWKANEIAPVFHQEQDYFAANTTTYQLNDDLLLKNIAGFSTSNTHDLGSSVGAPDPVFYSATLASDGAGGFLTDANGQYLYDKKGNHVEDRTYSNELQLQGKALEQALTYIVGAYYQYEDARTLFPQVYFNLYQPGAFLPANATSNFQIIDETPAAFAQSTYDFSSIGLSGLSFTAGARYTWESVKIHQLEGSDNLAGSTADAELPASQSRHYSDPSWTLGLSYQATDDLLLYLQGRRSWRAGGFNGTAPAAINPGDGSPVIQNTNVFKPEHTNDVELGTKFAGNVLGRPLRMNLAVYNQWIKDVQRAEFPDPPGPAQSIAYTVNVPEARVTGAEFDLTFKPARWLEAGVTGALTHARFVSGKDTAEVFGTTYLFGPYADVPKRSGSAYATVYLPTPSEMGLMDVRADVYGQSSMYFSNSDKSITPDTKIPGYGLVNLRYEWLEICGTQYSVSAFVRNLADKEYYTGGFALTGSLGVNSVAVGTPRMFGAEISYEF
ncbi:TonB-dependent receptor [Solimonas terrae]|uniref:TonB-dependent receptor n=1 Tax=Solimonas terrae TaxID=1396819 RepID=A0A6M2BUH6_9GAMM|nr:TonB-dependent receptor [Solimonas terrae]NGY05629.1 TonB-dependent receptor [Solimonas terrae]